MRLHSENTQTYLQSLAKVVAKDPMSLEGWNVVHVHPRMDKQHPSFSIELLKALQSLKSEHKEADCEIIICEDHDILFISHELDSRALNALAVELICAVHADIERVTYSLPNQWRQLSTLLNEKIKDWAAPFTDTTPLDPTMFGEFASLTDVFAEACKRRKSRNPIHILLVEDDPLTRRVASTVFKQNYALITAKDAQDAIASYFSYAPDIVFLDINLPDVNGFKVLQQIIANDPDAYVVMFSGNSYLDNITHALNSGAQGFVAKPFNSEKMKHYVTDCALVRNKHTG